jgi:signal transduction histidine kinase
VSLESAQLYERLQRKVSEQTRELREAQSRLLAEARRAGMAQIATNVLHNVGNVLNNVNVSAHVLAERVRVSRAARVADLAALLQGNSEDLGRYFESDRKGRLLPGYVRELGEALERERGELLGELARLTASVDHIKNVVAMQQSYAGASGTLDAALITELIDDALRIQEHELARHRVTVSRSYEHVRPAPIDKTRVMQILVNLIENAQQAMQGTEGERRLEIAASADEACIQVSVRDRGCGIAPDDMHRLFSHGFTTRSSGHGFGLHSCMLAAQEMGGSLTAASEGPGMGATFVLELPARGLQQEAVSHP